MKKSFTVATILAVSGALIAPAAAQEPTGTVAGDVVYFQDFKEFEPRVRDGQEFGGIARLAHVLDQLRLQEGDPTIAMGGELVGGSAFNSIYKGEPFVEAFNELGVDVGNFGNHDFDYGAEHALDLVELAEYDWISSNLQHPDGTPFSPDGTVSVQESGELRLGFVSLTADLDRTSAFREVVVGDFVASAEAAVDKLEGEDVDAIILLTQISREDSLEVMEAVPELDAALREENGASLPAEIHQTTDGRYLIGPDADYGSVAHLDITVNRATDEATIEPQVIPLNEDTPEDPAWVARSDAYYQELDDMLGGVIAHTTTPLGREELGIMVADSYRQHFGTDIGWQNGGGIRTELPAGDIALEDAYAVLPFGNNAVAIEATGAEILLGLEEGIRSNPAGGNGFPRVAGLTFEFDADAEFGDYVTSVTMEDGSPLDPDQTYTVAISQFLQEGGDNTTAFLDSTFVTPAMVTDVDAFAAYLGAELPTTPEEPTASSIGSSGSSASGFLAGAGPVFEWARQLVRSFFGRQ